MRKLFFLTFWSFLITLAPQNLFSNEIKLTVSDWSHTWFPVVTTSAPASIIKSKSFLFKPNPTSAAFSPLAITKSIFFF